MGCENADSIQLDQNTRKLRAVWSTVLDILLQATGKISEV
jgi:hypothetical protein